MREKERGVLLGWMIIESYLEVSSELYLKNGWVLSKEEERKKHSWRIKNVNSMNKAMKSKLF